MPNGIGAPKTVSGSPTAPTLGFVLQNAGNVVAQAAVTAGGTSAQHILLVSARDNNNVPVTGATVRIIDYSTGVSLATGRTESDAGAANPIGTAELRLPFGRRRVNISVSGGVLDGVPDHWGEVDFQTPRQRYTAVIQSRDNRGPGVVGPGPGNDPGELVVVVRDTVSGAQLQNVMVMVRPLYDSGILTYGDYYHPRMQSTLVYWQFPTNSDSGINAWTRTNSAGTAVLYPIVSGANRYGLYVVTPGYLPSAQETSPPFGLDNIVTVFLTPTTPTGPVQILVTCSRPSGSETSPVIAFIGNANGDIVAGPKSLTLGSTGHVGFGVGSSNGNGPYWLYLSSPDLSTAGLPIRFTLDNLAPISSTIALSAHAVGNSVGTAIVTVRPSNQSLATLSAATVWMTTDADGVNVVRAFTTGPGNTTVTISDAANSTTYYVWAAAAGYEPGRTQIRTSPGATNTDAIPVLVLNPTVATTLFGGNAAPVGESDEAISISHLKTLFPGSYGPESIFFFHDYTNSRRLAGPVSPDAYGNMFVPIPEGTGVLQAYIVSVPEVHGPAYVNKS